MSKQKMRIRLRSAQIFLIILLASFILWKLTGSLRDVLDILTLITISMTIAIMEAKLK